MLDFQNVTKKFGEFEALKDISLTVPKGSVCGLLGPNGAGKSTLIRCAVGAYRPETGSITLDGAPVWENPAAKARMAFIPDEIFYYPNSTMKDMAALYAQMYPTFDRALYNRLGELFALPKKALRRFSKGMQKQAAFLLCIAARPEMLILDEPVDGLDPIMRRQIWQILLEEVAQNGLTVLVSSHNLRELEDVCDYVGILNKGEMVLQRDLARLQDNLLKLRLAPGAEGEPEGLEVLHRSQSGKLVTLILRGDPREIENRVIQSDPLYYETVPLSLEEIFIYELGGISDEIRNMVL